jgi:hypothetical protein
LTFCPDNVIIVLRLKVNLGGIMRMKKEDIKKLKYADFLRVLSEENYNYIRDNNPYEFLEHKDYYAYNFVEISLKSYQDSAEADTRKKDTYYDINEYFDIFRMGF